MPDQSNTLSFLYNGDYKVLALFAISATRVQAVFTYPSTRQTSLITIDMTADSTVFDAIYYSPSDTTHVMYDAIINAENYGGWVATGLAIETYSTCTNDYKQLWVSPDSSTVGFLSINNFDDGNVCAFINIPQVTETNNAGVYNFVDADARSYTY